MWFFDYYTERNTCEKLPNYLETHDKFWIYVLISINSTFIKISMTDGNSRLDGKINLINRKNEVTSEFIMRLQVFSQMRS